MNFAVSIILSILLLVVLIIVHEAGHYFAAKKCGIAVLEFSIGFGPKIAKWNSGETQITVRALPLGGFVKFADDEDDFERPDGFMKAPLKKRVLTVLAGPAMNVVFAFVLAVVFLCAYGDAMIVVSAVPQDSYAYSAGIEAGDVITRINGVKIDLTLDLEEALANENADSAEITLSRGGEETTYNVPYAETEDGSRVLDVGEVQYKEKHFNFFEAVALSFKWLFYLMKEMISALAAVVFTGQGVENLGGIVSTVNMIQTTIQTGLENVLRLASLISLNLAIVNLLPIPALDGGKLVLYAVEGVRKKPASMKVEGILNLIGFAVIIGLAVFLVFQDIARLSGSM